MRLGQLFHVVLFAAFGLSAHAANLTIGLSTDVTWSWNGQRFKRLPKIAQPNKTFYKTGKLDTGLEYGYIPDAAHTDGRSKVTRSSARAILRAASPAPPHASSSRNASIATATRATGIPGT